MGDDRNAEEPSPVAAGMSAPDRTPLTIRIASDVVCPWCYIGERKLALALEQRPELDVTIELLPYQLHPYIPEGGVDKQVLLLRKFGTTGKGLFRRVGDAARQIGLELDGEAVTRIPHTLAAHTVSRWAQREGLQLAFMRRLFEGYFVEGQDIGEVDVLARLAGEVGLDEAEVREGLRARRDFDAVLAQAQELRERGVTGVPFFLVDDRFPIMGAQEPDTILYVIDRALAKREAEVPDGAACAT